MGFRTCYPKIWELGILNIFNWRILRKSRSKELTPTSLRPPHPSFLKQIIKLSCEICSSCTRRKDDILITRDGELGVKKSVQTNLVTLTLIFLVSFSPFTTLSPNPYVLSILHKFIVSCSKRYKSCLLWSLTSSGLHSVVKAPMYT